MEALIKSIADSMYTYFDSKTVGQGGDYGSTLTRGPYAIKCFYHQWDNITYPSIHLQIVQESYQGAALECCGGGVHALTLDFRISVDSKVHAMSIAMSLHEALREWLCEIDGSPTLTPGDYSYVAYAETPSTNYVYDGPILNLHVITRFHYVRQQKGEITP
jgi:hypothetical protein